MSFGPADFVSFFENPAAVVDEKGRLIALNKEFSQELSSRYSGGALKYASMWLPKDQFALFCAYVETASGDEGDVGPVLTMPKVGMSALNLSLRQVKFDDGRRYFLLQCTQRDSDSQDNLHAVLANLGHAAWEFCAETASFIPSQRWLRLRGFSSHREYKKMHPNWLDEVHPHDQDAIKEASAAQLQGELDLLNLEYRTRHKNGDWIWVLRRSAVLKYGPNQRPLCIVGTDTDITKVKQTEQEVMELSRKMQMAVQASGIGVWEFDATSEELIWDARCYEIYGCTPDDERPVTEIVHSAIHPDDDERLRTHAAECKRDNKGFTLDFRIFLDDGSLRFVRIIVNVRQTGFSDEGLIHGLQLDVTDDYVRTQELENVRKQLEHDAFHDALTGLPNRRYLERELQLRSEASSEDFERLLLLHIDLDRFKAINDTFGHAAGDHVLCQVAGVLKCQFDGTGFVARIGGDEFVALMMVPCSKDVDRKDFALDLADTLIGALSHFDFEGVTLRCGASVGIAYPEDAATNDLSKLMVSADMALYMAKENGRNQAAVFTPNINSMIVGKKLLADDMHRALENKEFIPYFQPIVDAATGDLCKLEALVRWNHPEDGIRAPYLFLDVAQEVGLLAQIDEQVSVKSIAACRRMRKSGLAFSKLSLNVSLDRLQQPDFLAQLLKFEADDFGLCIELLETIFFDEQPKEFIQVVGQLREAGIEIAIDDFGSGHASISSLLQLKPDWLKVDRSIISRIETDKNQLGTVKAIVDMAVAMGIKVIAEGVEDKSIASALHHLGCEALQGYAFSKPLSEQDLLTHYAHKLIQKTQQDVQNALRPQRPQRPQRHQRPQRPQSHSTF